MRRNSIKSRPSNARNKQHAANSRSWINLSIVQRAEYVAALKQEGQSNRSLAKKLMVDEGTIRRLLRINLLPEIDKCSLSSGGSAKKILAAAREKAVSAEEERARETVRAEIRRALSDQAARKTIVLQHTQTVLDWLRMNDLYGCYAERVLLEIERILWTQGQKYSRTRSMIDPSLTIEQCRPASFSETGFWLNMFIEWGSRWIANYIEPGDLRDVVFAEARRLVLSHAS